MKVTRASGRLWAGDFVNRSSIVTRSRMMAAVGLCMWGCAVGTVLAENLATLGLKSNQASKRGAGSARVLSGPCVVRQIFVSDRVSTWTDAQKESVLGSMQQALDFVLQQASHYGVEVSFPASETLEVRLEGLAPTGTFVDPLWTEQAIEALCQSSGNHWVADLRQRYQADNVLVCLHVNKPGLSYNLAHYDAVDEMYLAERMICFTRYPDGRTTAVATYAHEILHLFGAGDLYFPYDRSSRRKEMARRMFPDDVMRRVDYDIATLNVGPFTAFRVGWLDELKPEYRVFED